MTDMPLLAQDLEPRQRIMYAAGKFEIQEMRKFSKPEGQLEIVLVLHSVSSHAEAAAFAVDVMQERASLVTGEGRKRCKGHLHYETSRSDASRMTICSFDTRSVA